MKPGFSLESQSKNIFSKRLFHDQWQSVWGIQFAWHVQVFLMLWWKVIDIEISLSFSFPKKPFVSHKYHGLESDPRDVDWQYPVEPNIV